MMKRLATFLLPAVGIAFSVMALAGDNSSTMTRAVTADALDVAPVWSGHPVAFALLTHPPFQFVAFYDEQRQLTAAQRNLDERKWTFVKLPDVTGWDSHNSIALAVGDDGYLHLSADMHGVPLKYFRTTKPWNVATFERVEKMIGREEQRVTYPRFFRGPKGEFLFTYRDGGSGNGNQIYDIYNLKTRTWSRLLDKPLTDGEGKRNAYNDGPIKGPDGWFHLAYVWRETPDAASNHDLCYARSKDLLHWETGAGKPLMLPITLKSSEIVDPVPEKGGMINGNTKLGFDNLGRVTISYHKYDAAGNTQPWTARLENGVWKRYQITDWPCRWDFGGNGTLVFAIHLGPVHRESDGRLTQTFRHFKFGDGTWAIDPQTLRAIGKVEFERTPPELGKVEGAFPDLEVRWTTDSGESGTPGLQYKLRWETLGANRDKPRTGPLPPPSMLRLIAVRTSTVAK
jgi:hypothetical protein